MSATATATTSPEARQAALDDRLRDLQSLLVAYSGGVDSAFLAWSASRVLGSRALCVTADSPSLSDRQRTLSRAIAAQFGFAYEVIHTRELERPGYRANGPDRCYHCKHELYTELVALARARGLAAVADGSNADDRGDFRPGRRAARQFGVISPLDDMGMTKDEIRVLSRAAGLPTWDEPASPCLSSRVPYYHEVTDQKLRAIERAEDALRELGFRVVRVRHHGDRARVEIGGDELPRAVTPAMSQAIDARLRALGFGHVTLDVRGYRLGSLNEALALRPV